ncbi:MAG: helix-turn-helix transcriptional regulator [Coriobacteriales bacterium]
MKKSEFDPGASSKRGRRNETELMEKFLSIVPSLGKDTRCVSYDELADKMSCSPDDAKRIVTYLLDSDAIAGTLNFRKMDAKFARKCLGEKKTAGIPGLKDLTKDGGIFIDPGGLGILSEPQRLTVEESQALIAALELAQISPENPIYDKLRRGAMPSDVEGKMGIQSYIGVGADYEMLAKLSLLCVQHRLANIIYVSSHDAGRIDPDEIPMRKIAPYELYISEDNGEIYLSAYCYTHNEPRTFNFNRIIRVEELAEHSSKEVQSENIRRDMFSDSPDEALLSMDPSVNLDPRVWIGSEVLQGQDGRKQVKVKLHDDLTWVSRNIAAKLGKVRVEYPEELGREVVKSAREALADIESLRKEIDD